MVRKTKADENKAVVWGWDPDTNNNYKVKNLAVLIKTNIN